MRVVAVHLLNDFSGSPKVLMQLLKGWIDNKVTCHLFVGGNQTGFLDNISQLNYHSYPYQFKKNILLRIMVLLYSQFNLIFQLMFFLKKNDIVYINTVLPFGAGIIGKIKGCKVIYHIHETSVKPLIFKKFLFFIAKISSSKIIYVSKYIAHQEPIPVPYEILYNVLEPEFIDTSENYRKQKNHTFEVLMICSLKAYKGVHEFVALANLNPKMNFKLVLNANLNEIESFFKETNLPPNLNYFPSQTNTHAFYQSAHVILNLSDVNLWIETFGLTILEGMAYGLPAIVPPVGGVVELIDDNQNGFLINSKNVDLISKKLQLLAKDPITYNQFSTNSKNKSKTFLPSVFYKESFRIISTI